MRRVIPLFPLPFIWAGVLLIASGSPAKEFLTDKEIERIQDNKAIDLRVKIYMEAAKLRLKTAEERLSGKEPAAGDPFEFFTPEDLLDAYYRILLSVMLNLDDAYQKPSRERGNIGRALRTLKGDAEHAANELEALKRIAEEKKKEELWNLVNKAIDITNGAHEGAEYGLSKEPAPPDKKTKSR